MSTPPDLGPLPEPRYLLGLDGDGYNPERILTESGWSDDQMRDFGQRCYMLGVAAASQWRPIETAPKDMQECVVVRWVDGEGNELCDFDYREDGCWMIWHDHAERAEMIGGNGVSYTAPYQGWMPLPAAPSEPTKEGG